MNVHHLELFYYVGKYRGVVAACRQMPYGIQQPAMSAQLARLEDDLGHRLFERRPFQFTPEGAKLHEFITPFFGGLAEMERSLRGDGTPSLKLAGLTEVMREHVPALLGALKKRYPGLRLTLQEIDQRGAERLIEQGGADLAITVLESRLPPGFRSAILARLPLCLLVPEDSPHRKPITLFREKPPLISLPPHELLPRLFQKGLARRGVAWTTEMETSSQDLVAIYVRNGLGVGLAVATPELRRDSRLRVIDLAGFSELPIGAFWRGKLAPVGAALVEELGRRSREVLG